MRRWLDCLMFRLGYVPRRTHVPRRGSMPVSLAIDEAVKSFRTGLLVGRHQARTGRYEIASFTAVILQEEDEDGEQKMH